MAGNSVAEAAISGDKTVTVGNSINLTSNSGNSNHDWASSDPSIARVSGNKRNATVTGVSAGTVTITHSWSSWFDSKSESYEVTVINPAPKEYTVTFKANGGTGTVPNKQSGINGTEITLPGQGSMKAPSGKVFVGWSLNSNATGPGVYKPGNNGAVYSEGSKYSIDRDTILYATWANQNVTANFFVRLDGTIPTEPQGHAASEYTKGININKAIKIATFYTNSSTGVEDQLNSIPTTAQIKNVYKKYDSETQYILWYVIKNENDGWHVDGVLLDKEKVNLVYDANAPAGTWGNMPDGQQYTKGATATISDKVPTRTGYEFTGWNTQADGQGTSYTSNAKFEINEKTTLYAQWKPKENIGYKVKYYYETYPESYEEWFNDESRHGNTEQEVKIEDRDKVSKFDTHYFDESNSQNVLSGKIAADGSLVLKVYFKKKTELNITANSDSKIYDGKPLTNPHYTVNGRPVISADNRYKLPNGDIVSATISGSITNVSENPAGDIFNNTITDVKIIRGTTDVTEQYKINAVSGRLTITPAILTVTTPSKEKVYDGTALTAAGAISGLINEETVTFTTTGSQTAVGDSKNTYKLEWNGTAKESNYAISETVGTLKVTENQDEIVVTTIGGTFTYDGKSHGATVEVSQLPVGYILETATSNASAKDVTTKDVVATCDTLVIKNVAGEDVTSKLKVKKVDGIIKIEPAKVTITVADDSKMYGHKDPAFKDAVLAGNIAGELSDINLSVVRSNAKDDTVKVHKGVLSIRQTVEALNAAYTNYVFTVVPGDFEIKTNTADLRLSTTPYSGMYDGENHAVSAEASVKGAVIEYLVNGEWTTEAPNATDVTAKTTYEVRATLEGYQTAQGMVTLEITPKPITITVDNAEKLYGQKDPVFTGHIEGLVAGDTLGEVSYVRTNEDETVGTYEDVLTANYEANKNYAVTVVPGDFAIKTNTADLSLNTTPYSGMYDGKNHAVSAEASVKGAVIEYLVNGEWTTEAPNATDVTAKTTYEVRATLEGYQTAQGMVTLEITPKPITITVDNAEKLYGQKDPVFTGHIEGLVAGDTLGEVSYVRTNEDETVGTYEDVLTANYEANKNYAVTVVPGDFTITNNENTAYAVNYLYQNPQTGEYELSATSDTRTTTSGAVAFITNEDTQPQKDMYKFNTAKSDVQKHVAADGSTVLNVYFDALYNVVYKYTDGTTSYTVASSGHVYRYNDNIIAPGMASVDQFDGRWYKNEAGTENEWVFDADTISANIGLADLATHTIYLYTAAKVTPLNENTIRIAKDAINAPNADADYTFNLQLIANVSAETAPVDGEVAEQLQKLNAAKIEAESQLEAAQEALNDAEGAFGNTGFMLTTGSNLSFIMFEEMDDYNNPDPDSESTILASLYSITTGSAYEFHEYNLFEDSFDVRAIAEDANPDMVQRIVEFIEGMVDWRTPFQTLDPETLLVGLNDAGVNDTDTAIAFGFSEASNLYLAAKDLIGREEAYTEANEALQDYMKQIGRRAVITINGEQYTLDAKDGDGNPIFAQDEDGNYILNFDFSLKAGAFKDFEVTATTGSTVQYIITETYDAEDMTTTVNGVSGKTVEGMLTSGIAYTFVNAFGTPGPGPGPNPDPDEPIIPDEPVNPPSGGGSDDRYDGPFSDDETTIPDQEVPLAEPDTVDAEESVIEIEDPEVPLTDVPGETVELDDTITIDEPEVPLGDAPRTGDENNTIPFIVLMMLATAGMVITRRKFN